MRAIERRVRYFVPLLIASAVALGACDPQVNSFSLDPHYFCDGDEVRTPRPRRSEEVGCVSGIRTDHPLLGFTLTRSAAVPRIGTTDRLRSWDALG